MTHDFGMDLIKDIYVDGLKSEVIERHKSHFPDISLIVHKDGKFIQANGAVLCFEESENQIEGSIFTTTNLFPADNAIELLYGADCAFSDIATFDNDRRSRSNSVLDNLSQERIFENVLPKVCIFYIYGGKVIIDRSTMDDVAIEGDCGDFKNSIKNNDRLHAKFWDKNMTRQYPELTGKSYLSVPRGRVTYDNRVFKVFIDKEYFDNTGMRRYIEKECQLSYSKSCGYSVEYIKSPHYDYKKYSK